MKYWLRFLFLNSAEFAAFRLLRRLESYSHEVNFPKQSQGV
jgi:hypothetical protein